MLVNINQFKSSDKGFTVVELAISITVMGIILTGLFATMTYYFANMTRNNVFINMTVESQNLLRSTVEELRYGAGVRQSNTIIDVNEPAGGWTTSNDNFVIIISQPATDAGNNFIIDIATGQPYSNELVYFKSNGSLYKRILANQSAIGNTAVTSCPEQSATPTCPSDRKLADSVKDMSFTLYDQDNATTTDPLLARSIEINLVMERETFGSPLSLNNNIQVTLRNEYQ